MKPISLKGLSHLYNEKVESLCVRTLYFFNTLDSFFIFSSVLAYLILNKNAGYIYQAVPMFLVLILIFKIGDFHPYFILFSAPLLILFYFGLGAGIILFAFLANIAIYYVIQTLFMGIPDSIVARNPSVVFYKYYNSLFTLAPTTVSFIVSVYVSTFATLFLLFSSNPNVINPLLILAMLFIVALFTRLKIPGNIYPIFEKYPLSKKHFQRVVVLNIDGCRLDIFNSLHLPNISSFRKQSSYSEEGLSTVYRALTNPAFASILTGAFPEDHKIKNNNFGQKIAVQGLPDIVETILYGSMHVKHFSKDSWTAKVVSLPVHSAYKADGVMVNTFMDDFRREEHTRLFVLDFSEADFLAHAFGSTSNQYKTALRKIDAHIGRIFDWLRNNNYLENTGVIICSDHGIKGIDHSYLLFKEEKYVPFYVVGKGIRPGFRLNRRGNIIDICANISFMLGIPYPKNCRGQVYLEMFDGYDYQLEREKQIRLFNSVYYDFASGTYHEDHPEVTEGDKVWWKNMTGKYLNNNKPLNILDYGCGTGFVASIIKDAHCHIQNFYFYDISPKILEEAHKRFNRENYFFFSDFEIVKKEGIKFDLITMSSVLHHLYDPKKTIAELKTMLKEGGIIIGSHEPNKEFFQNSFLRILGEFYKRFGRNVDFASGKMDLIRQKLFQHGYNFYLSPQDIQQLVEYYSPVEQHPQKIDIGKGFDMHLFFDDYFGDLEVLEKRPYTTCFYRKNLKNREFNNFLVNRLLF
ncbi:MAG: alkaline phosphatase family protein, partial [Planctomycetes bacterium]|nr:alkaline phosphatase family protein [Planctomycetota bacterium]